MADKQKQGSDSSVPPAADPRAGRNAGYAENQPANQREANLRPKQVPKPSPDEPGIDRDTDAQPDPAQGAPK